MLPSQRWRTGPGSAVEGQRAGGRTLLRTNRRVHCQAWSGGSQLTERDYGHLEAAAKLAQSAQGLTQPHPNAGCVLVGADGRPLAETFHRAQGTTAAEALAVTAAGPAARGATAYLNLEPGDCHGEAAAVDALVRGGVSRVVVGIRHPLRHLRSRAIGLLRGAGVRVDVLADVLAVGRNGGPATAAAAASGSGSDIEAYGPYDPSSSQGSASAYGALSACLEANEPLLHRAVLRRPLGLLKYAMTLDGKIATSLGHSAWVSSPQSRAMVFETRARSDAVIVGGNTVRRDNPRLTTRREGGHTPARVVMSRTLDLPEDANLWDVTLAPTIVLTQRGARTRFQAALRASGVEVVEFDFLTPESVADYCQERGFLQCFWECGGTLAAPAIASGVVHKVMAFVAPKIIGGLRAPTPVGELGFVEMTQAVELVDNTWSQVGPDLMMTGYMPSSGGLWALEATLEAADEESAADAASASAVHLPSSPAPSSPAPPPAAAPATSAAGGGDVKAAAAAGSIAAKRRRGAGGPQGRSVSFYKAWDQWGALSNFSPHPISMPVEPPLAAAAVDGAASSNGNGNGVAAAAAASTSGNGAVRSWPSVEHYYQAHKFAGNHHPDAAAVMEAIAAAPSPEEAARIGRRTERTRPELLRRDWPTAKIGVMLSALRAKFATHAGPRAMLLATAGVSLPPPAPGGAVAAAENGGAVAAAAPCGDAACYELVEASPHDYYWGAGYERTGQNKLGRLLMKVRDELLADLNAASCNSERAWGAGAGPALAGTAAASAAAPASRG
ncbi:hypothetical protein HYH03_007779 [Edaphochlamys debaryana]|uniref:5-amino-6-(5-phosphoribosylamino)uracil reductase n=1 Tax=Edaphochlamys debaryana TaxID=47281 RepID=A0A836C061_9CHLO|nr:hypothetical protein HYH03_007779 [Edaphochlamys debaryana]|eukprot:KAG2494143.1 hypothetical protein HYH03_007779 [Edaphochlamys debaryana]